MLKKIVFSVFVVAALSVVSGAGAQQMQQQQQQQQQAGYGYNTGVKAPAQASSVYLTGVGPINLRPGYYIAHPKTDTSAQDARDRQAAMFAPIKPTSVTAYNKQQSAGLRESRMQSQPLIPSPFPAGYGN